MVDGKLRVAQSVSGLMFAGFLLLHLANQMSAVLGASTYDRVQGELRSAYRLPFVELTLVLLPLGVHIGLAGAAMWRRERRQVAAPTLPARLHRWTGHVLLLLVVGHVAATRLPAVLDGVEPTFAGVAFTFRWMPLWFWPYYSVLALAGWYHLLYGLAITLPQLGLRSVAGLVTPKRLGLLFALGAAVLLAAIVSMGTADESAMRSDTARWWLARF
jgi:succinate dehydrogenase/fumarate reductase cytochrome b subunit